MATDELPPGFELDEVAEAIAPVEKPAPRADRAEAGPSMFSRNGSMTRVPPHDAEAEIAVLGSILLEPSAAWQAVEGLRPIHFYRGPHGDAFDVLSAMASEGTGIDPILFRAALQERGLLDKLGGTAFISRIVSAVPTAANAGHYAERVMTTAHARDMITAANRLEAAAYDGGALEIERAVAGLSGVRDLHAEEKPSHEIVPMRTLTELRAKVDAGDVVKPRYLIEGLMHEKTTTIVFGPPSAGKSVLAWELGLTLARGFGDVLNHQVDTWGAETLPRQVGLFLGENSESELAARMELRIGDGEWPEAFRYCDVLAQDRIHALATEEGRAWYERQIVGNGLQVCVFDNLMSLVLANLNDSKVASDVMAWLKSLSKRYGCTHVLVAHVNKGKGTDDGRGGMERLYGAQEWGAWAGGAIWLDFEPGPDGKPNRSVSRRIVKQEKIRDGKPMDPAVVDLDADRMRFKFMKELGAVAEEKKGHTATKCLEALRDLSGSALADGGWVSRNTWAKAIGCSSVTLRRKLNDGLVEDAGGLIESEKRGSSGAIVYRWKKSDEDGGEFGWST